MPDTSWDARSLVVVGFSLADSACENLALSLGSSIRSVSTPKDALRLIEQGQGDALVIFDSIPLSESIPFIQQARAMRRSLRVVLVGKEPVGLPQLTLPNDGGCACISAPADGESIRRSLELLAASWQSRRDRFFASTMEASTGIVGRSLAMRQALDLIGVIAESHCNPVLILGETGTGKELAARAIHDRRCNDPDKFIAVNCATMTASLFESELFGHVRGAFTGADRDKVGLLEMAQGGSILLDEISEMPVELQAKLLRVLQEREFRRVGGTKCVRFDATIIASSNRDLLSEVAQGRFRRDLYYRLAVLPIQMPALRHPDRRCDIPLLAEYFLGASQLPKSARISSISDQALAKLMEHDWAGNVRELKNVIERAILLENGPVISVQSIAFCQTSQPVTVSKPAMGSGRDFSLETAEREFILRALNETGWQRTRAAALLGISRATLHAKIKRYEMTGPEGEAKVG